MNSVLDTEGFPAVLCLTSFQSIYLTMSLTCFDDLIK